MNERKEYQIITHPHIKVNMEDFIPNDYKGNDSWKKNNYDSWMKICRDPMHKPPGMLVITKPYTHTCPGCGQSVTIYPSLFTLSTTYYSNSYE